MPPLTRLVPFTHEVPVDLHRPEDADGALVVFLHGMGQSAEYFAKDALPCLPARASALIPQAPLPFEVRGAKGIRQGNGWYVYTGEKDGAFLDWMRLAEEWVVKQVDFVVTDHGFDAKRVSLVGFSQGGYLAGWVGVRHAARFAKLVVAGGRIKHEGLEDDIRRAAETPLRVLAVHGRRDEGVLPDAARRSVEALAAGGVSAEFREYDCGHPVLSDPRCRVDVREFLA